MNATRSRVAVVACAAAAVLLTGCWSQNLANELDPLQTPPPRGPTGAGATGQPTTPTGPGATTQPRTPETTGEPGTAPSTERRVVAPGTPTRFPLPAAVVDSAAGGATVVAVGAGAQTGSGVALLRVLMPFGAATSTPTLADVALAVVTEAPQSELGLPSLRGTLGALGGDLAVEILADTTALTAYVPIANFDAAVKAVASALARPIKSEAQIVTIRERLARDLAAAAAVPDLLAFTAAAIHGRLLDVDAANAALFEVDLEDVELFRSLRMTPSGSVVAASVPGVEIEAVADRVRTAIDGWREPAGAPTRPDARPEPTMRLFAPADVAPKLLLLFPRVDPVGTAAAELMVLQHELAYGDAGPIPGDRLGFRTHLVDGRLALVREIPSELVPGVEQAWSARLQALLDSPPDGAVLARSAALVRLALLERIADPTRHLGEVAESVLRHGKVPDYGELLARLESPRRLDLREATRILRLQSISSFAIGRTAPATEGVFAFRTIRNFHVPPERRSIPAELAGQQAAADGHLANALRAVGGADRIALIRGLQFAGTIAPAVGPEYGERIWFTAPDRLVRVREILNTTLRTRIVGTEGVDTVGDRRVPVPDDEVAATLAEAAFHPLMLLAERARGGLSMRLLALRKLEDRDVALLESLDPRHDRLRIGIDVESGLVRLVEYREVRVGVGTVHVRRRYGDYRTVDGIRAPHLVTTTVDEADAAAMVLSKFEPTAPAPSVFER